MSSTHPSTAELYDRIDKHPHTPHKTANQKHRTRLYRRRSLFHTDGPRRELIHYYIYIIRNIRRSCGSARSASGMERNCRITANISFDDDPRRVKTLTALFRGKETRILYGMYGRKWPRVRPGLMSTFWNRILDICERSGRCIRLRSRAISDRR